MGHGEVRHYDYDGEGERRGHREVDCGGTVREGVKQADRERGIKTNSAGTAKVLAITWALK